MEIAGLTLGVVPMIVMTFQGYRLVHNFATEYNSYNQKLRSVLRDIFVAGSLFTNAFDVILAEVVEGDRRKLMLENPSCEYWSQHDLDGDIKRILRGLFEPMVETVCGARETLLEIKRLLLILSGNEVPTKRKSTPKKPLKRLTLGVTTIATSFCMPDPLSPDFQNIQINSTAKKLISLAKDHRGELQLLRDQLRAHNRDLLAILRIFSHPTPKPRAHKSLTARQTPSTPPTTGNQPHGVASVSTEPHLKPTLEPNVFHTTSRNLHRIVSNTLPCECHTTHLSLERQAKDTAKVEDSPGKSTQLPPTEPETRFSFQLSAKSNESNTRVFTTRHQVIHLVFTCCERTLNGPETSPESLPESDKPCPAFCTVAQNQGYEGYFYNTSGSCNSGFRVQRTPTPIGRARISSRTSLEDLIKSRSGELQSFDRFRLAANLAYSLVRYYSSPWVRDWSLKTIHFFEKQEQLNTTPGQWTPHLPFKPDHLDVPRFGDKNREVYLLGMMLLQLGQRKCLDLSDVEGEQLAIGKALGNLCREMGPKYTKFVENCLVLWCDRNTDLMRAKNLKEFLSHINVIEKGAQYFVQEW